MKIDDWGLIEYEASTLKQIECVNAVSCGDAEQVIFCSHPPVVTLGRGTEAGDLTGWNGATVETSRGGRATYHGPSQLVIYPILDLKREREGVKPRDVHSYLRALESIVVAALRELGMVEAEARTTVKGADSLTGVWVGEHKIASIGIAVR